MRGVLRGNRWANMPYSPNALPDTSRLSVGSPGTSSTPAPRTMTYISVAVSPNVQISGPLPLTRGENTFGS